MSKISYAGPESERPLLETGCRMSGVETIGATGKDISADKVQVAKIRDYTCIPAWTAVSQRVAVDLVDEVALAIVVVAGRVDGAALGERADEGVSLRCVWTEDRRRSGRRNTMFGAVGSGNGAVVHDELMWTGQILRVSCTLI